MESDYNELQNEQIEETIKRMKTYESIHKIHSNEPNSQPEYSLFHYFNELKKNSIDHDSNLLIVIEHSSYKKLQIIQQKVKTLLNQFPRVKVGLMDYQLVHHKELQYSNPQSFQTQNPLNEKTVNNLLDRKYDKRNVSTIVLDDLFSKIYAVHFDNHPEGGKNVVLVFSNSYLTIGERLNAFKCGNAKFIDKMFVFITQKFDCENQKQFGNATSEFKMIDHLVWDKYNLNENLTNELLYNELIRIIIEKSHEDYMRAIKEYKNKILIEQNEVTMNGITIELTDEYLQNEHCFKSYHTAMEVNVKQCQLTLQAKNVEFGEKKIVFDGVIDENENVAVKIFHHPSYNIFDNYIAMLEGYSITSKFVNEFVTYSKAPLGVSKMKLFVVYDDKNKVNNNSIEEDNETKQILTNGKYSLAEIREFCQGKTIVLIEEFEEGMFYVFNKSTGKVIDQYYLNVLNSFSHYTYVRSSRRMLLYDIQGVIKDKKFVITSPFPQHEIKCRFGYFGEEERVDGLKLFKQQHVCNERCEQLQMNGLDTFEINTEMNTAFPVIPVNHKITD